MLRSRSCSRALALLRWRASAPCSSTTEASVMLRPNTAAAEAAAETGCSSQASSGLAIWLSTQLRSYSQGQYKEMVQQPNYFVTINNLRDVPGATKARKRVGRGDGGDRGKTSGKGHKGQKARSGTPGPLFDGGTRHLRKFPKVHLQPKPFEQYAPISLARIIKRVKEGRLPGGQVLTMRDLWLAGCTPTRLRTGVRVVQGQAYKMNVPALHLQVSACDPDVRQIVEAAGGTVTTVYYTRLGLRAVLKPENFEKKGRQLPSGVSAIPPKWAHLFDTVGQVPPNREVPALPAGGGSGAGSIAQEVAGMLEQQGQQAQQAQQAQQKS